MLLSNEELWRAFTPRGVYMDDTLAKLRAVEAAVRADQIGKDAAIADMQGHLWSGSGSTAAFRTADTIRAQLTEGNTDE